ncbi:MAG: hypothetical protein J4473_03630 [Candidatus Aenigmarchaeota archaeon]|nr:hypothetical protein [Candidatus Aenigmarchaeota archaeon]
MTKTALLVTESYPSDAAKIRVPFDSEKTSAIEPDIVTVTSLLFSGFSKISYVYVRTSPSSSVK